MDCCLTGSLLFANKLIDHPMKVDDIMNTSSPFLSVLRQSTSLIKSKTTPVTDFLHPYASYILTYCISYYSVILQIVSANCKHVTTLFYFLAFTNISALSKYCYSHIRELRSICSYLDLKTASTVATSTVFLH